MNKILIIDDFQEFINLLKENFKDYEFSDLNPINDSYIENIISINPDLIILDINLPYKNGIAISQDLLKNKKTSKIPIIVISSTDYNSANENLLKNQENIYYFLSKFSPLSDMKEKIDKVIKNRI